MTKRIQAGLLTALVLPVLCVVLVSCRQEQKKSDHAAILFISNSSYVDNYESGLQLEAAQMAVAEKNSRGGIGGKQIELIPIEEQISDPAVTKSRIELAMKEHAVHGMITTIYSKSVKQVLEPIAEKNKIPLIVTSSSLGIVTKGNNYIFRTVVSDTLQAAALAGYAATKLKLQNTGIICEGNNFYSKAIAESFKTYFVKSGGNCVFFENGKVFNETSITELLKKYAGKKIDSLFIPCEVPNIELITGIALKLGMHVTYLGTDLLFNSSTFKLPEEVAARLYFTNSAFINTSAIKGDFIRTFKKQTGKNPGTFIINTYNSANILITAIEHVYNTSSDSEKKDFLISGQRTKDYLYATEFDTVLGKISFFRSGDAEASAGIYKIDKIKKQITQIDKVTFTTKDQQYLELPE